MISDKDLGLKVAETPEEKLWHEMKEKAEQMIRVNLAENEIQAEIIKLADRKLAK